MPASRRQRATTLAPRSWPSRPTLAIMTRIGSAARSGDTGSGPLGDINNRLIQDSRLRIKDEPVAHLRPVDTCARPLIASAASLERHPAPRFMGGTDGQARVPRHGQRSPRDRASDPVEDYLDPGFRGRITLAADADGQMRAQVDGKVLPPYADRPERQRAWSSRTRRPEWERMRRGTPPKAVLEAMDTEGIDIGILFRTWATHAINIDGLEPALAAALSRAWNRWIAGFCTESPERLKPSALVPLQDIDLAVGEARFAVRELGAITL